MPHEQCVDLECEEGRECVPLGRRLPRLVVGDDQPVRRLVDPVEDPADRDAVEILEHVELPVHRFERRRVFDAEVVGEHFEALEPPGAFCVAIFEQLGELDITQLDPGRSEEIEELLGTPLVGWQIEETLQCDVGRRAASLVDRRGSLDLVDRPELEELWTRLVVARPAR